MKDTSIEGHHTEPDCTCWAECEECGMVFQFLKEEFEDYRPHSVMTAPSMNTYGPFRPGTIFFHVSDTSISMLKVRYTKGTKVAYSNPASKGEWTKGQWESGVCPVLRSGHRDALSQKPHFSSLADAEDYMVKLSKDKE